MRTSSPVVLCLAGAGERAARRIADHLDAEFHGRADRVTAPIIFEDFVQHTQDLFLAGRDIIGVCAAGALIRALAPLLGQKRTEPAVVAISPDGASVVPLLGGHRGANALAERIAELFDAKAAITTAGDTVFGVALDAPPEGWRLDNPQDAKAVMAAALAGGDIDLEGDAAWLAPLAQARADETGAAGPRQAVLTVAGAPKPLRYAEQRLALGLGAARGADPRAMTELVDEILRRANMPRAAIAAVFSIDLKADEAAINQAAAALNAPLRTFSAAELEEETPRVSDPSEVVFNEVGCHSVAEAAALRGAGPDSALLHPKIKAANCTAALAIATAPIRQPPGRARGRLALIGTGPGRLDQRTPEATRLAAEADELVGYGLYLDLLGPLAPAHKRRTDFKLGEEEARCRYALERAGEGLTVALVCSGDPSIYAMGALVMELIDRAPAQGGVSDAARRAELIISPGVSALQSASARAGALLGHDFCAISLSDLLTPWETIERRVAAAAEGDFVIAFYNPVSERRRWQLEKARDILLRSRSAETPVLIGRQIGRPQEQLHHVELGALKAADVDMLTVVLVGSSQSRAVQAGDRSAGADGWRLYTPRGYAKKLDALE
ncbi:MAG: precorrin-3B C(17)-methyltransferase [Neomegalonema sp.]|nr:precorrin-3B C(17)-methyltransferase [Neomegalonema sp.]